MYVFVALLSFTAIAQTSSVEIEKSKLTQALNYGDKEVATNAMYNIIAIEGPQSTYKDSLAYLYFNRRNYLSCYLVAQDVLQVRPNNEEILEMSAFALESLGAGEKAIEEYQKLLTSSNSNYYAYKISEMQYELQKYDDAFVSIQKAASLSDEGRHVITYQINQNYNQQVALKAAIPYLEGMIYLAKSDQSKAKVAFEKAVAAFPDFILAKEKLNNINEAASKN